MHVACYTTSCEVAERLTPTSLLTPQHLRLMCFQMQRVSNAASCVFRTVIVIASVVTRFITNPASAALLLYGGALL